MVAINYENSTKYKIEKTASKVLFSYVFPVAICLKNAIISSKNMFSLLLQSISHKIKCCELKNVKNEKKSKIKILSDQAWGLPNQIEDENSDTSLKN